MAHEGDGDINYNWCTWNNPQMIGKETGRLEAGRMSGGHLDYGVVGIDQSVLRCPSDLSKLAVTQTPVKVHRWVLVRKSQKGVR